jgi:hypothetical protein|tara:strand:+ start:1886 stop:2098 length:213 start_codon:yes stop_codon:yes gene_type:complete
MLEEAEISVSATRPHDEPFEWRETHARIDALALTHACHGCSIAKVYQDQVEIFHAPVQGSGNGVCRARVG